MNGRQIYGKISSKRKGAMKEMIIKLFLGQCAMVFGNAEMARDDVN